MHHRTASNRIRFAYIQPSSILRLLRSTISNLAARSPHPFASQGASYGQEGPSFSQSRQSERTTAPASEGARDSEVRHSREPASSRSRRAGAPREYRATQPATRRHHHSPGSLQKISLAGRWTYLLSTSFALRQTPRRAGRNRRQDRRAYPTARGHQSGDGSRYR